MGLGCWTTREKLVGTLVVPGGLALPIFLAMIPGSTSVEACSEEIDPISGAPIAGTEVCTSSGGPSEAMQILGPILLVVLLVAPIVTTAYLARRMRRREATAY